MSVSLPSMLGVVYMLSEIRPALRRRAKESESRIVDRGSLGLLWMVIVASVFLAYALAPALPATNIGWKPAVSVLGIVLFIAGLAIRCHSIIHLGRFFTVNVAIATDHKLIDTGPYHFVRHPSYTGALMVCLGLGLCIGNWVSVAIIIVPVFLVFLRRMLVEESALLQGLADPYRNYMNLTKRLIPAIY